MQDSVLSTTAVENLRAFAYDLKEQGLFRQARIGRPEKLQKIPKIRGDQIHWIKNWQNPNLEAVVDIYGQIITTAKKELFLGIKRYESHFSAYVSGTHYSKHIDQHANQKRRQLSSVLYLSPWTPANEGELCLYLKNSQEINVSPLPGRLIVFRSDIEHEVKMTKADRWSLSTWFRDDTILKL